MGMIIFIILGMVGALSLFVFVKFYSMAMLAEARSEFKEFDLNAENFHAKFACRLINFICVIFGVFPSLYPVYLKIFSPF